MFSLGENTLSYCADARLSPGAGAHLPAHRGDVLAYGVRADPKLVCDLFVGDSSQKAVAVSQQQCGLFARRGRLAGQQEPSKLLSVDRQFMTELQLQLQFLRQPKIKVDSGRMLIRLSGEIIRKSVVFLLSLPLLS